MEPWTYPGIDKSIGIGIGLFEGELAILNSPPTPKFPLRFAKIHSFANIVNELLYFSSLLEKQ